MAKDIDMRMLADTADVVTDTETWTQKDWWHSALGTRVGLKASGILQPLCELRFYGTP